MVMPGTVFCKAHICAALLHLVGGAITVIV